MSSASPPEYKVKDHGVVDMVLRVILFAASCVAVVFMATSKQTKMIWVGEYMLEPRTAKFNDIPAFIYYVAALSVVCLYSIITCVLSVIALMKPNGRSIRMLLLYLILDALLLGIMASSTGAAGAIVYLILIGDKHRRRDDLCDTYSSCW